MSRWSTPHPVTHSAFDARAIGRFVQDHYAIGDIIESILYRSYVNDVYRLRTRDGTTFFFKVARRSWRSIADVRWEVNLQLHLTGCGVRVSRPLPQHDGNVIAVFDALEGPRAAVLSAAAPGVKPCPPHDPALYATFGQAAARMHTAMDTFDLPSPRPARTTAWLVTRSASIVRDALPTEGTFLDRFAAWLAGEIDARASGLDWGVCHGDLTLDNLMVAESDTITFFDFDLADYGWRAMDLCTLYAWSLRDPIAAPYWRAFLEGYRAIRPFPEADEAALPLFTAAYELWDTAHEIEHWRKWSGHSRSTDEIIARRVERMREWQDQITGTTVDPTP